MKIKLKSKTKKEEAPIDNFSLILEKKLEEVVFKEVPYYKIVSIKEHFPNDENEMIVVYLNDADIPDLMVSYVALQHILADLHCWKKKPSITHWMRIPQSSSSTLESKKSCGSNRLPLKNSKSTNVRKRLTLQKA
jgi:hypothetical protein